MAAVGVWPVPWAPYGRLGGVRVLLGPVWPLRGRDRFPGPRMATVKAWPVPWALYGRCWGVANPLGPVWPPWGRGRFHGPCITAVGECRLPGPRMAAVGAW